MSCRSECLSIRGEHVPVGSGHAANCVDRPRVTVGEQTMQRLVARQRELVAELDGERDPEQRRYLRSELHDVSRQIDQALTWIDTPTGRAEVQS